MERDDYAVLGVSRDAEDGEGGPQVIFDARLGCKVHTDATSPRHETYSGYAMIFGRPNSAFVWSFVTTEVAKNPVTVAIATGVTPNTFSIDS